MTLALGPTVPPLKKNQRNARGVIDLVWVCQSSACRGRRLSSSTTACSSCRARRRRDLGGSSGGDETLEPLPTDLVTTRAAQHCEPRVTFRRFGRC
jgi:hypothetical protein